MRERKNVYGSCSQPHWTSCQQKNKASRPEYLAAFPWKRICPYHCRGLYACGGMVGMNKRGEEKKEKENKIPLFAHPTPSFTDPTRDQRTPCLPRERE